MSMATGCSDHGVVYGPPGGLAGKSLPPPTLWTSGAQDSDGGEATDAAPPGDGDTCSVSWSGQIFAAMSASGRWKCGDSSCHGGLQSPRISSDARATYQALAAFTMPPPSRAVPFLSPGSTDPSQSGIECNLSGSTCGVQMPLTQAGAQPPTQEDLAMIDTWVKCGAPEN
jgi:hypothetical protein